MRFRRSKSSTVILVILLLGGCMSFVDPGGDQPPLPGQASTVPITRIHENTPLAEDDTFPLFIGGQWIYRSSGTAFHPDYHPVALLFNEVAATVRCIDPRTGEAWECFVTTGAEYPGTEETLYIHRTHYGLLVHHSTLHDPNLDFPGFMLMRRPLRTGDLWAYNVPFGSQNSGSDSAVEGQTEVYWDRATYTTEASDMAESTIFAREVFARESVGISAPVSSLLGTHSSVFRDAFRIETYEGLNSFPEYFWYSTEPTITWAAPGIGVVRWGLGSKGMELATFVRDSEVTLLDETTTQTIQSVEVGANVIVQLRGLNPRHSDELNWYLAEEIYTTPDDGDAPILSLEGEGPFYSDITTDGQPLLSGSHVYTFRADAAGYATLRFTADDAPAPDTVREYVFNLRIGDFNIPPNANDDHASIPEDTPLILLIGAGEPRTPLWPTLDLLGNDSDRDPGDRIALDAFIELPAHGTLEHKKSGTPGSAGYKQWYEYVPAPNFHGMDTFSYRIVDRMGASDTAHVSITVLPINDTPESYPDDYKTDEDVSLAVSAPGLLMNDTDADLDQLMVAVAQQPLHGVLALEADGGFHYTPDQDWFGTDEFTYVANDGESDSQPAIVTIIVLPVNDPPVAVNDTWYTLDEDTRFDTSPLHGVLANDVDVDHDELTAVLASNPSHGSIRLHGNGQFEYEPDQNWSGVDRFTYRAADRSAESNLATVTLTVHSINDNPTALNDEYQIEEDAPETRLDVLENDRSDPDVGESLTIVSATGSPLDLITISSDSRYLLYTPPQDFSGMTVISYRVSDGHGGEADATATVLVAPINDPPVAVPDLVTIGADTSSHTLLVLENDYDPDEGDSLRIVRIVTPPSHGIATHDGFRIVYTPSAAAVADSLEYEIVDLQGQRGNAIVEIMVRP